MPPRDTARENAFSAIRDSSSRLIQWCRDTLSASPLAEATSSDAIADLLAEHGFAIEREFAGVAGAYRATLLNHDAEAMRKGLRHGHVGLLIPYDVDSNDGPSAARLLGAGVVSAAAIGLAATLSDEYATITVIILPDDMLSARTVAATGVFGELDVLLGARAASPGGGFCYTINGTGDRLASLTVLPRVEVASSDVASYASTLADHESVALEDERTIVVTAATLSRAGEIVETFLSARADSSHDQGELYEIVDRTGEMLVSRILARRVKTYGDNLDLQMDKIHKTPPEAPTIWNNLSHIVPAFEMAFSAETTGDSGNVELPDEAFEQMIRAAECLCFTGLDIVRDMSFRAIADDQLVKALRERGVERPHRRWLGVHRVQPKPEGQDGEPKKRGPRLTDFSIVSGPGLPNPLTRHDN